MYDYLDANLEAEGISCECVGGGKITHDPENKSITIFGKSQVKQIKFLLQMCILKLYTCIGIQVILLF